MKYFDWEINTTSELFSRFYGMLYTNGHWRQTSGCRGCRCTCCLFGLEVLKSIKDYIMTKYRDIFFIIPALIFFYITKYILLNKSRTHTPTFQGRLAPMRMVITIWITILKIQTVHKKDLNIKFNPTLSGRFQIQVVVVS